MTKKRKNEKTKKKSVFVHAYCGRFYFICSRVHSSQWLCEIDTPSVHVTTIELRVCDFSRCFNSFTEIFGNRSPKLFLRTLRSGRNDDDSPQTSRATPPASHHFYRCDSNKSYCIHYTHTWQNYSKLEIFSNIMIDNYIFDCWNHRTKCNPVVQ